MGEEKTQCLKQEKFEEIAFESGRVTGAVERMELDINRLYEQSRKREIKDDERNTIIVNKLNDLDKGQYGMKVKFSLLGAVSGILGTSLMRYILDKVV